MRALGGSRRQARDSARQLPEVLTATLWRRWACEFLLRGVSQEAVHSVPGVALKIMAGVPWVFSGMFPRRWSPFHVSQGCGFEPVISLWVPLMR